MSTKFVKMQGAGNDFVMLQPIETDLEWSQLAVKMCDRRFGIGADGIILALPSKVADVRMRIFNPDGSEAETCGNGLRCLAKYAVLNKMVKPGATEIAIETIPGVRIIKLGYHNSELSEIRVGIGVPKFAAGDIPIKAESGKAELLDITPIQDYPLKVDSQRLLLSFVSMGNPHAVHFIQQKVVDFPLLAIGPKIEHYAMFPRRINFEIARIIDRSKVEMRVWERGAGETLACGTGACAVAVAARLHGYVDNKVDITLPGGILNIEWDGIGEVLMSGPAEVVFTGDWP
jgi:diaminopimelate epimerase